MTETTHEVVEAVEGQEVERPGSSAIVPAPAPTLAVTPQVTASELVQRLDTIREAQEKAMIEGVDYGVVPGTDKPTLLKPGSEKLGVLFQLDVQLRNEKSWGPGDHLTVLSHATVFHAPTGARLGYGEGICTSRERKYAYRRANRKCPECQAEAILLSRDQSEGFFCWRKRGGCGAKFTRDDSRVTSQEVGDVENPDLPDTWNTVDKMASKRARIDAVLAVTGASALFTQDLEDQSPAADEGRTAGEAKQGPNGNGNGNGANGGEQSRTGFASDRQENYLRKLLKDAGLGDERDQICAYLAATFSGGQGGGISRAIEGLADDSTRSSTAARLANLAGEWAESQSDVPADTADLPEADA